MKMRRHHINADQHYNMHTHLLDYYLLEYRVLYDNRCRIASRVRNASVFHYIVAMLLFQFACLNHIWENKVHHPGAPPLPIVVDDGSYLSRNLLVSSH